MADARPTTPPLGGSEAAAQTITAAQKQALIDNLRLEGAKTVAIAGPKLISFSY
jgi:hypothetical protein